jgi:acyl carrier protein
MNEKVVNLIYKVIEQFNNESETKIDISAGIETRLFGGNGKLDSLALVNLIVSIEEAIEEEFNNSIILADEKAMSRRTSPFSSIKTLVIYIDEILTLKE